MKKLLKKINVFALALILIGGVAISTQSAFTNAVAFEEYGYDYDTETWYNLNDLPSGATFQCTVVDPLTDPVCKRNYDGDPNGGTAIPGSITAGGYGSLIP